MKRVAKWLIAAAGLVGVGLLTILTLGMWRRGWQRHTSREAELVREEGERETADAVAGARADLEARAAELSGETDREDADLSDRDLMDRFSRR